MFCTSILSALPLFLSIFLTSLPTLHALPSNLEPRQDNVICGKVNPIARTCTVLGNVLSPEGAMTITVNVKDSVGNIIGTGSSPYPLTLGADNNYPEPSVTGDAFACGMNSTWYAPGTGYQHFKFQCAAWGPSDLPTYGQIPSETYETYVDLRFPCWMT